MTIDELTGRLTCSVPEAAQALGIGRDAAYAAAARGEIPTVRFGRRLVVPVARLLQMLGVTPDMSEPRPPSLGVAPQSTRKEEDDEAHSTLRRVI